jgi:hypothetical protein
MKHAQVDASRCLDGWSGVAADAIFVKPCRYAVTHVPSHRTTCAFAKPSSRPRVLGPAFLFLLLCFWFLLRQRLLATRQPHLFSWPAFTPRYRGTYQPSLFQQDGWMGAWVPGCLGERRCTTLRPTPFRSVVVLPGRGFCGSPIGFVSLSHFVF